MARPPLQRYLVFYSIDGDAIRIARVIHGSRDAWALLNLDESNDPPSLGEPPLVERRNFWSDPKHIYRRSTSANRFSRYLRSAPVPTCASARR